MKFSGKIGFYCGDIEVTPGVYKSQVKELPYFGDILIQNRRWQSTEYQNDTLTLNNRISIVSDLYAWQNWASIRYVVMNGAKLKVTNVDVINYPRLTLEVGGVYNGVDEIIVT